MVLEAGLSERLVDDLPDAIVVIDRVGKMVLVNKQTEIFFGYQRHELLGQVLEMLLPERLRAVHVRHREAYFIAPARRSLGMHLNLFARKKDGSEIPIDISLSPIAINHEFYACATIRDIMEQKKLHQKLHKLAFYDVVTGLPNRFYFHEELVKAIEHAKNRTDVKIGVFYLDLDYFKKINDMYGYEYGDLLLKAVGKRIRRLIRKKDFIAKQSGDEFTILLRDTYDGLQHVDTVAKRLIHALKKPFVVNNISIECSTSVGIALFPTSAHSADDMIKNANIALTRAKNHSKKSYSYFSEKTNKTFVKNMLIENQLRDAIHNEELSLVYQPIIDLRSKTICGAEALLRWKNKKLGNVMPKKFIAIAEESGLMGKIGCWVIREIRDDFIEWNEKYPKKIKNFMLSMNVSAGQLQDPDFRKLIAEKRNQRSTLCKHLILELTETTLMRDIRMSARIMRKIHSLGVRFAVDDFGTGYSSLYYLKKLPIDFLKIDQQFLQELPLDKHTVQIIEAIIKLGEMLHIAVVAEGISLPRHVVLLQKKQCPYGQGYYFSVPLPPAQFEETVFADKSAR